MILPELQNKAYMNILVHAFWSTYAFISAENISIEPELLSHVLMQISNLSRYCQFSKMLKLICTTTSTE